MTEPLRQTTGIDVDAVPEVTTEESRAPAGAAGSPLPAVGTNAKSEWAMWDPNLWWTDWTLPPDPRPSWELWFDWVNQLQALAPALGEASQDWQTLIGQFDESLRNVRNMRAELADWTGPSAQTMAESLDRLEESITTKSAAIQNNPSRLQELARTINDAVPPMAALDAEYQQVLQDLNACRQVAERGKPIMLNLATQLLQVGTDLENSVRTDNLAPQPVPPQPLTLTEGPRGPGQQLAQVAGPSNLADPGTVTPGAQVAVADMPAPAGSAGLADPGQVQSGQAVAPSSVPGVAVGPADQSAANTASPAQPSTPATASPTLAGLSAGTAAPAPAPTPVVATPAPTVAASGPALPVTQFVAPPVASGPGVSGAVSGAAPAGHGAPVAPVASPAVAPAGERRDDRTAAAVVGVPVPVVLPGDAVSGSAAVPAGLRGRTVAQPAPSTVEPGRNRQPASTRPDGGESLDTEAFKVEDVGTGTVTAPR